MIKCIKEKCPYYCDNDHSLIICQLSDEYYLSNLCIGFSDIKPKMEKITCQISDLMNEYNKLSVLENYIQDNQ